MRYGGRIRKAIIPVAGLGTRLFPATRAFPKALLPVPNIQGQMVPIIHILVEEAAESGIEHIGLVIRKEQRELFETYFHTSHSLPDLPNRDTHHFLQEINRRILRLGCRVEFISQSSPEGFGHAVFSAKRWLGREPFLLLLGDHLYRSYSDIACCRQLIHAYHQKQRTVFGMTRLPVDDAPLRGCLAGTPDPDIPRRYTLTRILEKPSPEQARKQLRSPGLQQDEVFALFGCYAFTNDIFNILDYDVRRDRRERGEIQLTLAMDALRELEGCDGYEIDGDSLDVGNMEDYKFAFSYMYSGPEEDEPEEEASDRFETTDIIPPDAARTGTAPDPEFIIEEEE